MRGALGDCNALHGDVVYDFAKVYQSLCGYDFIIHDQSKQLHHLRNVKYIFLLYIYIYINMCIF